MKLNTFCGHLVSLLHLPMSEFTELQRALKEQSPHFDPVRNEEIVRKEAERQGIKLDYHEPAILRGKAGPGGGIDLDPFRAAFFLLAVALNGPRRSSAEVTWQTWHLNQEGSILTGWGEDWQPTFATCRFTGAHLFGEALSIIIEDEALARRVKEVRIASNLRAEIVYDDDQVSLFNKPYGERDPSLYRLAVVAGHVFVHAAQLIKWEG